MKSNISIVFSPSSLYLSLSLFPSVTFKNINCLCFSGIAAVHWQERETSAFNARVQLFRLSTANIRSYASVSNWKIIQILPKLMQQNQSNDELKINEPMESMDASTVRRFRSLSGSVWHMETAWENEISNFALGIQRSSAFRSHYTIIWQSAAVWWPQRTNFTADRIAAIKIIHKHSCASCSSFVFSFHTETFRS